MTAASDQYGFKKLPNGLIINTDDTYYKQLKAMRSQRKQSEEIVKKVESLESDISEIKNILLQLVHRNN